MNDNTTKLIEQLAAKLGTTSEYLWGILIKQAPVAATVILTQIILIIIAGFVLYKSHLSFSDDDNKVSYYNLEEGLVVPFTIAVIIWVILVIVSFFMVEEVINGYFNPEFWALNYIMDKLH